MMTLALASALGLLISLYFTLVTYGWMRPDPRWLPAFCRMEENSCRRIVDTRQARVFGIPNSLLGIFYYAFLLGAVVRGFQEPSLWAFRTASAVTVGLGAYLTYALLFRLRIPCPLCLTSHGLNLLIFALLWTL
ncbi:MAG: vitamin K epoxide reductase family protein [Acidobacteria bacterium]|nr:vitamin K epoxide reductase family protein [Acidobacteriota bacterium]